MGSQRRKRNSGRQVDGVLLLDKPAGCTSNQALQRVKRLFNANKAGHTGSLDPLASGLLPVCLGQATKVSAFLLDADKHYTVTCRLGSRTDTGDAEGTVVEERAIRECSKDEIQAAIEHFSGEQTQIPPMYSALKHKGKRLYELARQGKEVEREPRRIVIHELTLLRSEPEELDLAVHCSKGTYVRTLVEDLAAHLGNLGHVTALRRSGVGPYDGNEMVDMQRLEELAEEGTAGLDAVLLPVDSAIQQWPSVKLASESAYYLRQGQPVMVPQAPKTGWVRLYSEDARFLGMGQITDDGRVAPKRLFPIGGGE